MNRFIIFELNNRNPNISPSINKIEKIKWGTKCQTNRKKKNQSKILECTFLLSNHIDVE